MSTTDDPDSVECPVEGCSYEAAVDSVAAHVLGTRDQSHSLNDLTFDGTDESEPEAPSHPIPVPEELPDEFDRSFARDALALLELVRGYGVDSLEELDDSDLADLYSLLSDLSRSADDARKEVRDELLDRLDEDAEIDAAFGEVTRYSYESTDLMDDERVAQRLERAGIDPESVTSLDPEKVERAVEETEVDREDVFEVEEVERLRLTETDAEERREKLSEFEPELRDLLERL